MDGARTSRIAVARQGQVIAWRHTIVLLLQVEQESMKGAQVAVDAAGGVTGGQAMIHIVKNVLALDVQDTADGIVFKEPALQAGVSAPKARSMLFHASRSPVTLSQMLVALQLLDEPIGQAGSIARQVQRMEDDLCLAALLVQEAAKLVQGTAAHTDPSALNCLAWTYSIARARSASRSSCE